MTEQRPVKIAEHLMQPAEMMQANWFVTAPAGAKRESSLHPMFWAHVHRKIRALSRVTVIPESGEWYQELLCIAADGPDVRMVELNFWMLDDTSDVGDHVVEGMRIKWRGPLHRFNVERAEDGMVLAKGFQTRGEAQRWMHENGRRSAA